MATGRCERFCSTDVKAEHKESCILITIKSVVQASRIVERTRANAQPVTEKK